MLDAALDLLLGESCVGCGTPGRLLCAACASALPATPFAAWPAPPPPGLATPWAAAPYDATVRAMVLGLKEHRLLALARPLSGLLAGAIAAAVTAAVTGIDPGGDPGTGRQPGPVVLVPVPSRPATVRVRGHDSTRAVTSGAARLLRRRGLRVVVARPLRLRRRVRDQSGLDAEQRAANLTGSMGCAALALGRVLRVGPGATVVVCDDVLTTGSTAREAQRALEASGVRVTAVAVVAATPRRTSPDGAHHDFSADRLSWLRGTH